MASFYRKWPRESRAKSVAHRFFLLITFLKIGTKLERLTSLMFKRQLARTQAELLGHKDEMARRHIDYAHGRGSTSRLPKPEHCGIQANSIVFK